MRELLDDYSIIGNNLNELAVAKLGHRQGKRGIRNKKRRIAHRLHVRKIDRRQRRNRDMERPPLKPNDVGHSLGEMSKTACMKQHYAIRSMGRLE